ncbi:hypothetical protein [Phenylobacterium sp.]|uniref:hypothetical protein n=1 Tax=Phenylobacterium sp. TaxID=1871053 RepID=UPI0035B18A41
MSTVATAIAAVGLIAATSGAALAAGQVTDMDYLKASRCRGLDASGKLSPVDSKALDSYLKAAEPTRSVVVLQRAQIEETKAKREARYQDSRDRLNAELTGPCMAYMGASPAATASAKGGETLQN